MRHRASEGPGQPACPDLSPVTWDYPRNFLGFLSSAAPAPVLSMNCDETITGRPPGNELIRTACSRQGSGAGVLMRAHAQCSQASQTVDENICTRINLAGTGFVNNPRRKPSRQKTKKPPITGRLKSEEASSGLLGLGRSLRADLCLDLLFFALDVALATLTFLHFVGLSAHNFFTLPNWFCWLAGL